MNVDSIKGTLKGKIAGIPVWLLVLVMVGGLVFYFRRKATADANTSGDSTGMSNLDYSDLANALPSSSYTYITVPGTSTGGTDTTVTTTPGAPAVPPSHPTPPSATPPPKSKSVSYVVKSGDNLTRIAAKYGVKESTLFNANKTLIEAQAKKHGYKSSDNGHWIFPGEKLVVPA